MACLETFVIVKICDSCQKLLFDQQDCAWVAIREHGALLFKKWKSGMADKNTVSHFCTAGCALEFCGQWLDGKLAEPEPQFKHVSMSLEGDGSGEVETVVSPLPPPRDPTPQEIAEQNSILRSLGI